MPPTETPTHDSPNVTAVLLFWGWRVIQGRVRYVGRQQHGERCAAAAAAIR